MKFSRPICPKCGKDIGSIEVLVPGVAGLDKTGDNTYQYAGATDMEWDEERPIWADEDKTIVIVICSECTHSWATRMEE